jgi:hypothetical protein
LYSAYISAKTNLQKSDKEYTDACTEIAIYKTEFDKKVKTIIDRIKRIDRNSIETQKEEKNKIIQEITLLKINYMKILFRIADAIMEIYNQQKLYFVMRLFYPRGVIILLSFVRQLIDFLLRI